MKLFWIFLVFVFFMSCDKTAEQVDIKSEATFLDMMFLGDCFYFFSEEVDEMVITNEEEYKGIKELIWYPLEDRVCDTAELPFVDFDTYMLVGKKSSSGGCGAKTHKTLVNNNQDRIITYGIVNEYYAYCSSRFIDMNWVLLPIKYKNHSFIFETEENLLGLD